MHYTGSHDEFMKKHMCQIFRQKRSNITFLQTKIHYYNDFLLGELMEVVQNGGKSFKTHSISVNVQSLIWRTDAVYYRCKIKGINGTPVECEQIIVRCTFVFNQIEATANNITGTG